MVNVTTYVPEAGLCETGRCRVVVEEWQEMVVVKPGTAWRAALKTGFVYIYQEIK
jgi:hypothetical protein